MPAIQDEFRGRTIDEAILGQLLDGAAETGD